MERSLAKKAASTPPAIAAGSVKNATVASFQLQKASCSRKKIAIPATTAQTTNFCCAACRSSNSPTTSG